MTDTTLIQTDDYSILNLVHWLNAKYRRHGELEDKAAADALEQQAAQIAEKDAQIARLKTVMIAAAEEIGAHWDAHCDAEGYGPVNLLRRLEQGIPSEYGYTARAFAHMKAEVEALRADAERLRASAEKVILFNRDHANDQYGDPNKAEAWACVRELRAALRQEQPT